MCRISNHLIQKLVFLLTAIVSVHFVNGKREEFHNLSIMKMFLLLWKIAVFNAFMKILYIEVSFFISSPPINFQFFCFAKRK